MVRTQIYITAEEKQGLEELSERTGKTQSELIREAIDRLLQDSISRYRSQVIREAAGTWQRQKSNVSERSLRNSWDRG